MVLSANEESLIKVVGLLLPDEARKALVWAQHPSSRQDTISGPSQQVWASYLAALQPAGLQRVCRSSGSQEIQNRP